MVRAEPHARSEPAKTAQTDVSKHYSHGCLVGAIRAGIGKAPETVAVGDLASIDEFQIAGRRVSEDSLD
jgi:hypothetical protein